VTLFLHLVVETKRTVWNSRKVSPAATSVFEELLLMQADISDSVMAVLERLVMLFCDWTSGMQNVNE